MSIWDVIVAGGGPAGMATALSLRGFGYSVLVVEATQYDTLRPGETLAPYGKVLLESLGVWERFTRGEHRPSHGVVSAWGRSELDCQDFLLNPYGSGWSVDRCRFDAMLATAAEDTGVVVLRRARVTRVSGKDGRFEVTVEHQGRPRTETALFIVDATGRAGRVAGLLGVKRIVYDRMIGVVAALEPAEDAGPPRADLTGVLLLEASSEGWWYSVPLPNRALLVAYMTDGDILTRSGLAPAALWSAQLEGTTHTRERAMRFKVAQEVRVTKAATSRLASATGADWIAVGDAASAYDPLSAQGLCKALASGIEAGAALDAYRRGAPEALAIYASTVTSAFNEYRKEQVAYYALERRWVESLFWRRRHAPDLRHTSLYLDPSSVLEAMPRNDPEAVMSIVEGFLPVSSVVRLHQLCASPIKAHRVVSLHQAGSPGIASDRDIIVALQLLIERSFLRIRPEDGPVVP
ncbi:MAG TPA: NAD(P)/FAD-dependent oxidoreductase [Polyangiaceae bacterium]|jgi:2-polyprenyl-6-methoxyphenol hydroxylase-like FAD-dependent oxidoreductase|nr:NAD(P)/FAD-dependent oxidoreductase [Polyangiaceae bacterium]